MTDHYDLIVIGSGPGGASLAQRLAPTGKRILILERGDYLRARRRTGLEGGVRRRRYQADETWTNAKGDTFSPALHYYVGGNSKVYGAALFRLRERDFGEVVHAGGVSPAWPLGYDAFAPWYDEAEALFHVHGRRGEDPLEPPARDALSVRAGEATNPRSPSCRTGSPASASSLSIFRSASCSIRRRTAARRRPAPASAAAISTASRAC